MTGTHITSLTSIDPAGLDLCFGALRLRYGLPQSTLLNSQVSMNIYSVNKAVDDIDLLDGKSIYLEGSLSFKFENVSINHHVHSEAKDREYQSSIWLQADAILQFDRRVMEKWSGKKVLVEGTLVKPDPVFGAGHMGLWPATIVVTDIELSA